MMRTLLAFVMLAPTAYGDHCRVAKQQVVVQNELVAVPFVAPLGVVITGSPMYSYRGVAQSYQQPQAASVDPDYAEFLAWKAAKANQVKAAVVPPSLIAQNCNACHTKAGAKSSQDAIDKLNLDLPRTAEGDKAALKSIRAGKMPKGKTIDDQTRGGLFDELLGLESTK